jgi:hypothetical protein
MENNYETIKIWKTTLKNLRLLHALLGESIVKILDRLVRDELKKVQASDRSEGV